MVPGRSAAHLKSLDGLGARVVMISMTMDLFPVISGDEDQFDALILDV